jgi:hypothetical protein
VIEGWCGAADAASRDIGHCRTPRRSECRHDILNRRRPVRLKANTGCIEAHAFDTVVATVPLLPQPLPSASDSLALGTPYASEPRGPRAWTACAHLNDDDDSILAGNQVQLKPSYPQIGGDNLISMAGQVVANDTLRLLASPGLVASPAAIVDVAPLRG